MTEKDIKPIFCSRCGAKNEGAVINRFLKRPADVFDYRDIVDLARAVRRADRVEAEAMLDRIFRDEPIVREWIAQGRAEA